MAKPSRESDDLPAPSVAKAFLVVHRGGRWTDLLRLSPDRTAVIGRASSNQIVIRSHQASRQHAELRWDAGRWWVRDLGSRNGTFIDGRRIEVAEPLTAGCSIEVAGCAMQFVTQLSDALGSSLSPARIRSSASNTEQQLTEDQMTIDGLYEDAIVHRATESRYLNFPTDAIAADPRQSHDAWQTLFALAFQLASVESIREAAEQTMVMLTSAMGGATRGATGGVFLSRSVRSAESPSPELVAFVAADNRSYRPPANSIVQSALSHGNAVIVRNIVDDGELQEADSRGEFSTTTAIVSPIPCRRTENNGNPSRGYLHLYTTDAGIEYSSSDLDLVIAAAGVLAAAIDNLQSRGRLANSLRQSRKQIERLRQRLEDSVQIVGNSKAINHVKQLVDRVAQTNTTVLIRGESGVGKELVAAAIHQSSPRRDAPMVCLNCAALSPTLLESELFGHEKGAFTGATEQKKGKFESADGGTLMLDEIGEMHVDLQAKLLRVLEGHPFERLGGQHPIKVDVRLVAATNRDLASEVQQGRFRADLFYRLNVVEIVVPPLRHRRDDILPIANHYLAYFSEKTARRVDGFTREATELLQTHSWPGNIRELKNVVERAVVLGAETMIDAVDLNITPVQQNIAQIESTEPASLDVQPLSTDEKTMTLDEVERQHLLKVLRELGGNKSRAAILLGIERSTLDRKLKRYDIKVAAFRSG
jgi:transcriptional regulator with GAF, ATPase, and Fis domain